MSAMTELFNWFELDVNDLGEHLDGAKQLQTGASDGFLIRNVLSQQEASAVVEGLSKFSSQLQFPMPFGQMFGEPLMITQPGLTGYLDNAQKFRTELLEHCGLDFDQRLIDVFTSMSGGRNVSCPSTNIDELYGGSVIRIIKPHTHGLHVHAGNEFVNEYESMKDLSQQSDLYDQLSFFVVLQAPEEGGELSLYDLKWEKTPQEVHTERYPHFSLERDQYFANIECRPTNPQVGDMIFFAGGRIWHQVNPHTGERDRITMGGFTSFSHDDQTVYFWS